jgi:hypothetical protein
MCGDIVQPGLSHVDEAASCSAVYEGWVHHLIAVSVASISTLTLRDIDCKGNLTDLKS